MRFMKKNFKILLLSVFVAAASCSFTTKDFNDPEKDKLLIDLITYVLEKGHYDPQQMDDTFSANVYEDFINTMDPLKRYFTTSDLNDFSPFKTQIDDQIQNKDLTFFDLVYNRYIQRSNEVKAYYKDILSHPFDYTVSESINVDYDHTPWASNENELKERWRKQLKFTTLSNFYDLVEEKSKGGP